MISLQNDRADLVEPVDPLPSISLPELPAVMQAAVKRAVQLMAAGRFAAEKEVVA